MIKFPAFLQRLEVGTSLITMRLFRKKPIFMVKVAWYLFSRKIYRKPRYKNFLFAPHYKCNFSCDHCSQARLREIEKNEDVMTTEEMIAAIKKCLDFGALSIDFIGGESLLYKDFDKLVEACNPSRTFITMVTNGYMLNEKMIKHLIDIGVDKLNISIDSWYPEEHDKMRGVKGAHKKAFNSIELCRKLGMFVDLETVVFRDYTKSDSFMKVVEYCMKNKVRLVMVAAVPLGSWEGNYDMLISEEDNRRMKELHQKYPWITRNCVGQKNAGCPAGYELLSISSNGDVQPCDFIRISFGNIKTDSLASIVKKVEKLHWFNGKFKGCITAENRVFIEECLSKTWKAERYPTPAEEVFDNIKLSE